VKFLITSGVGKFYSNGLDVHQPVESLRELNVIAQPFFVKLLTLPVVTIAAINGLTRRALCFMSNKHGCLSRVGHAFGMGALIAFAHDYRIMQRERGWLSLPEARLGFSLPAGLQELVRYAYTNTVVIHQIIDYLHFRRKIGSATNVRDCMLYGKIYTAEEALVCQIVDKICERGAAVEAAIKFGQEMLAKKQFRRERIQTLKEDLYRDVVGLLMASEEPRTLKSKL
jgi:enoyl-CoA hydratase/carnithine racemase